MATERHINDMMGKALDAYYCDTLNDKPASWLKNGGAGGRSIAGLWHSYWDLQAIPDEQFCDRQHAWLESEGTAGDQVNDKSYSYWSARA